MIFSKTYTLDKALVELRKYNQSLDNIDDILQLAIEERIKISFEIPHSQVLVRMDEEHFKMEECYISRLDESYLIPSDREKIGTEFLRVAHYEQGRIYPFIKSNDLKNMVARNNNWVLVYPLHMKSLLDNRLIEVAPCTIYPVPKRNDIKYELFREWAWFAGLEILDGCSEQKVTDISALGKYESSGYLFRLENKSKYHGYRIDKNQLRITKNEIENFIKNEYLNLSLPHYSLKKAKQIINQYASIKTTKTELIELAQNGIIKLSIHNPEWRYVQTDRADQELEVKLCKVLREYSIHILTPKKGLVAGTGTEDSSLLCGNGHSFGTTEGGTIYPFIDPKRLRNMELSVNKTLKIYTHEMDAIFQDQSIKVSKVDYAVFPEKGDPLYPEFTKWLKDNLKLHHISLDEDGLLDPQMHFDSTLFYKLEKHKGRGVEVKVKDLVITKEELGKYTLSIMNEGHVAYEKNKELQLDAAKEALWVIEACYDEGGEAKVTQGSGFQLQYEGIITCAHVVTDNDGKIFKNLEAYKVSKPSKKYNLKVDKACSHRDVAICSISSDENPPKSYLGKSQKETKQQLNIKLMGFPAHDFGDKEPAVVDAKIARSYTRSTIQKFEIDQSIREGNSGGPIIDVDFNVIGIALEGATKASGRNGCLHISELKKLTSN